MKKIHFRTTYFGGPENVPQNISSPPESPIRGSEADASPPNNGERELSLSLSPLTLYFKSEKALFKKNP